MPILSPTNEQIAVLLDRIADQLEGLEDNPYRVQAFRKGAQSVRETQTPLTQLVRQEGGEALKQLEGIGEGLATTIFEFIHTGRSEYLQDVQTRRPPEEIFQDVPGIGPRLARRIVYQLGLTSLEALAQAAHEGHLEEVKGFGPRRTAAVRQNLEDRLGLSPGPSGGPARPPVALLLAVDADYRRRAAAGELLRLAPRRFNPNLEPWLPVMQTGREGWAMTALFSNTAEAHELGQTHDWVVIYYQKDGPEGQCTVITPASGPLKGKRVVRGREQECKQFYQRLGDA